MLDRDEAQAGRTGHDQPHRDAVGDTPLADRPMADREVPLPGTPGASAMALHQWLDGDLAEAEARRVDDKQVELWSRIATETDRRRRMTTPAHLASQIMAALPEKEVSMSLAMESTRRIGGLTTSMALAIGAGFFTLGVVVGKVLSR